MGVAHVLLASIHPPQNSMNTRKQNMCHTLLISNYSIASELTHSNACNVDLNLFHSIPKPKVILLHKNQKMSVANA